jgi:D-sedoheptulose 7-phosphate isomerase
MSKSVREFLDQQAVALGSLSIAKIDLLSDYIVKASVEASNIWIAGNGGSATTAAHLATDLNKGLFLATGRQFKAICLNEFLGTTTAWSNDTSFELALEGQINSIASKGDLVIIISGSGKSKNVINLAKASKKMKANVLAITGIGGGELINVVDEYLCVDSNDMQTVENIHLIICHAIYKNICEYFNLLR